MKKTIYALCLLMTCASFPLFPADNNDMKDVPAQTEDIWRTGSGAQDGTFSSVSLSMLGWGVGLAAGIAIVASVIHQSTSSHDSSSCSH
jgi:hypothetical protein